MWANISLTSDIHFNKPSKQQINISWLALSMGLNTSTGSAEIYWLIGLIAQCVYKGPSNNLETLHCHVVNNTTEYKLSKEKKTLLGQYESWLMLQCWHFYMRPQKASHLCISLDTVNRQINVFKPAFYLGWEMWHELRLAGWVFIMILM